MYREKRSWVYDLLFLLVLVLAGYLRLTGVNWGEEQHQHPDENFLTSVLGNLQAQKCADSSIPVEACPPDQKRWISLGDYLNSGTSTLNPYNRGFSSFVYGDLPMTMIRVAAEATDQLDVKALGRQFSALADLFTILMLYFVVSRLYGQKVGLLAALFSSLAVMQIQQSHFFTTDLFVNAFAFLAIYFAVVMLDARYKGMQNNGSEARQVEASVEGGISQQPPNAGLDFRRYAASFLREPLFLLSLGFGFTFGMSMASKVNIYPLAFLLPGAFILRYFIIDRYKLSTNDGTAEGQRSAFDDYWLFVVTCLIAGGLAAFVSFRIFQPYAFNGLLPSQHWIEDIQQQRVQAKGIADLPWNLQWARRSHLYSFENLTIWGLGLPLGILAWLGFLWMGWRILKGEWRHALLWGWTAIYFLWQSLQFNPTMRYQLPIYPLLAMMAAWFIFEFPRSNVLTFRRFNFSKVFSLIIGLIVIPLTAAWAFAFHSIYLREEPRIAASRWIFQNVPGPINVQIQTADNGVYNQPVPFPTGVYIQPGAPYQTSFIAQKDGLLKDVLLAHVTAAPNPLSTQLYLSVWQILGSPQPLASAFTTGVSQDGSNQDSRSASFDQPPVLLAGQTYYMKFETVAPGGTVNVCGAMHLLIQDADQITTEQVVDLSSTCTVTGQSPYMIAFVPQVDGTLSQVTLEHVTNTDPSTLTDAHTLDLVISNQPNPIQGGDALAGSSVSGKFFPSNDPRGDAYTLTLDQPVTLQQGTQYYLSLAVDSGSLSVSGASVANETDYDYGLPFRVDGYDAFGGIYRGDLNLQVYWDDNEEKLNRFVTTLDQTDYIFIPTNHQYAQITRVPERYPLTTLYYRELMGCPLDVDIISCYYKAQPGDYQGKLGFDLVAVFETFPRLDLPLLGKIEINDQHAEEAFTFYDHPKVFVFKKNADFDIEKVRSILGSVDLTKAVHLTPPEFSGYSDLMLSAVKLAQQRAGGTWSQLFNYEWIQNRYPVVGLVIWYIFIFILGLAVYPLIRLAMPGLADKGYPLSRALGLVLFAYLAWMAGSVGIPNTRVTIAVVLGIVLLIGVLLGYSQRAELREEWRTKRKYFLMIEGLFLGFFLIDLLIRLGNPDLWHPARGGERPMDFSYFNAVIKSTSFPPYDPWFAGGYINYYYYGFVLVGTPVKLLGIVPSIAYNFILPTLFAIVGISAFSIGSNLVAGSRFKVASPEGDSVPPTFNFQLSNLQLVAGLSASSLAILLGNLGTIQLIYQKMQQLAAGGGFSWDAPLTERLTWAVQGFVMALKGSPLPIGLGDWYWNPSRVIPPLGGNEITEFPLFTFLYSDLHAHMLVMPIALLAISWALSVLAARARWTSQASAGLGIVIGGLILGAVYPTNLSDSYTYLLICIIALGYSILRYADAPPVKRIILAAGGVAALVLLSRFLYQPYHAYYLQAYSALDPWKGPFTPMASYLTHWGVFLFIVASWMAWETREWMAATPLSSLKKLKPYQLLIEGALVSIVLALLVLQFHGTSVGWIALPLAAWAGVLLLRPDMPDSKRFALFLIGTALLITIVVEVVVVRGDIGRQNTIFKFYMQSWLLLAVGSGAALAWTLPAFFRWLPGWRLFWQSAMILLLSGAALFTVTGTSGKIRDRWIAEAPHTLDSMTYMKYAQYDDFGQRLDLSEDYRAIRWMQDHVQGSPVLVEANCVEYHWCTRFTIYTGLPGVVGWNWHQRQQRVYTSTWVQDRVDEVGEFYNTTDIESARNFLKMYAVKYIIVGQLERAEYTPEGIAKFSQYDGTFWRAVYREGSTAIYEVLP